MPADGSWVGQVGRAMAGLVHGLWNNHIVGFRWPKGWRASRGAGREGVRRCILVALRSKVFFHPDLYQAVVDYVTPSEMEHHSNHGPTTARNYRRTKGPLCVRLNAR